MPVPSLAQLATKCCIKNVNTISDIGDAEYSIVRPILLKLQNPEHLYQLEQKCPQIIGDDAEIWREFCKRDVPNYEQDPQEPANPRNWYKCYQKLYKAGQREIDADAALLKASMDNIKNKQARNKAQQVELRGVKVPSGLKKDIPTIALPKSSSLHRAMRHAREGNRELVEKAPPKAISVMAKIRRDTTAHSHLLNPNKPYRGIDSSRETKITPNPWKTTKLSAPRSLIEEHQRAKIAEPIDPTVQPHPAFNPRKRRIEHVEAAEPELGSREAQEKRLRALTNPSGAGTPLSSTITPPANATTPLHRQQLAKANSPPQSSLQSRTTTNTLSPGKVSSNPGIPSGSPMPRADTSSAQTRTPMRIHHRSDNPFMPQKRRPVSRA